MKTVPEKNDIVTVLNIRSNDGSYQDTVWNVVAVNKTHAKLVYYSGDSFWKDKRSVIVAIKEFEFSPAEDFV